MQWCHSGWVTHAVEGSDVEQYTLVLTTILILLLTTTATAKVVTTVCMQ